MGIRMTFSLIETLAIAAGGILLGKGLVRLFPILQDLCLPEPVLGGLLLCVLFSLSEFFGAQPLQFDLTLQTPLMIAFFLSIGWMASWKNLRAGGSDVIKFFLLCGLILVSQNLIGMGLAKALGQNPLVGALAGSVSLAGGPGTALAFAPAFEKAGVVGAGPIGTAAALAGIIMGGVLGSPLAARLISRFRLHADRVGSGSVKKAEVTESPISVAGRPDMDVGSLMNHLKFFFLVMALGAVVGQWIQKSGIILPIYIGAMIVAALLRNWHDLGRGGAHKIKLSHDWIEELGSIALSYFLVTATMTLQLKQLAGLATVLVIILAVQAIWIWILGSWLVFRFFGKNYDAAVIGAGFTGFMLGTTANAMANLNAVTKRYGPAPRAYLVVPLVGACGTDFVNAGVITAILALFR
jgi:ESS family glutamate:Na+ symporter